MNDAQQSHKYLIQLEIDSDDVRGTISRLYEAQPTMHMEPVVDHSTLKMSVIQVATEVVRKN